MEWITDEGNHFIAEVQRGKKRGNTERGSYINYVIVFFPCLKIYIHGQKIMIKEVKLLYLAEVNIILNQALRTAQILAIL